MGVGPRNTLSFRTATRQFAAAVLLLFARDVTSDPERWHLLTEVSEVEVRVHWVSMTELRAVARTYGKQSKSKAAGFAVLKWNPETDEVVCELFLTARPTRVDDRATMTIGHEMAHCLGFSHQLRPGDAPPERFASRTR